MHACFLLASDTFKFCNTYFQWESDWVSSWAISTFLSTQTFLNKRQVVQQAMHHSNHVLLWIWVSCICFCESQQGDCHDIKANTYSVKCMLAFCWPLTNSSFATHIFSGNPTEFLPGPRTMKFQGFLVTRFWIRPIHRWNKPTSNLQRFRSLPVRHPSWVYENTMENNRNPYHFCKSTGLLFLGAPVKVDRKERTAKATKIRGSAHLISNDPIQGVWHLRIWRLLHYPGDVVMPRCACHRISWLHMDVVVGVSGTFFFVYLYLWYSIFTYTWLIFMVNVGKCR